MLVQYVHLGLDFVHHKEKQILTKYDDNNSYTKDIKLVEWEPVFRNSISSPPSPPPAPRDAGGFSPSYNAIENVYLIFCMLCYNKQKAI